MSTRKVYRPQQLPARCLAFATLAQRRLCVDRIQCHRMALGSRPDRATLVVPNGFSQNAV